MSYDSDVLALTGLVGYWRCNDTAGTTTIADAGPYGYTLSQFDAGSASGKVDGATIVTGLGNGGAGNGTNRRAFRTNASGIANLRMTGTQTHGMWVVIPTAPTSTVYFGGRNNAWRFYATSALIGLDLNSATGVRFNLPPVATEPFFLAWTYDGTDARLYVNGALAGTKRVALTDFTDPMELFNIGSSGYMTGTIEGVFSTSTCLDAGQVAALYESGRTITPPTQARLWDLSEDDVTLVAGTSLQARRCPECGGIMRTGESAVTVSGVRHHAACYTTADLGKAAVTVSDSTTVADLYTDIKRVLFDNCLLYSTRKLSSQTYNYWDGTTFNPKTDVATYTRDSPGVGRVAAMLHRTNSTPRGHWTSRMAFGALDNWIATRTAGLQLADPGVSSGFALTYFVETMLLVKDVATKQQWARWKAAAIAAALAHRDGAAADSAAAEYGYYTNGNVELVETLCYWLMWRLTGDAQWLTNFTAQWEFTLNPPQTNTTYLGFSLSASHRAGFGLVIQSGGVTTTTRTGDWAGVVGYLKESVDAGTAGGFDGDYTMVHLEILNRLYYWQQGSAYATQQADTLRILNAVYNKQLSTVNQTTATVNTVPAYFADSRSGSRHSLIAEFRVPSTALLVWRGLRSDLPATLPNRVWQYALRPLWTVTLRTYPVDSLNYARMGEISGWLMSHPSFPVI